MVYFIGYIFKIFDLPIADWKCPKKNDRNKYKNEYLNLNVIQIPEWGVCVCVCVCGGGTKLKATSTVGRKIKIKYIYSSIEVISSKFITIMKRD